MIVDHFDHAPDHMFRSVKICDYTILQGANGFDIFMGFLMHLHGLSAYGQHFNSKLCPWRLWRVHPKLFSPFG